MNVRVEVETDDIQDGERCSISSCPVARAATRATKKRTDVNGSYARFYMKDEYGTCCEWSAELPKDAKEWIKRYDEGMVQAPIAFNLSFFNQGPARFKYAQDSCL